ncbi:hypothetical protein [Novipirellula rosea]|uniref:hypothetical protein n=1 Tax=Novipirellula rosea TaxID=1031540 RepID=UPI0031ED7D51
MAANSKPFGVLRSCLAASETAELVAEGSVFCFSGTEYKTFRSHFMSSAAAERSGFCSSSKWKRSGREPLPIEKSVLCVAKAWTTFSPKDDELILGYSQMNNYLVTSPKYFKDAGSMGCWPVFSSSETQPIQKNDTNGSDTSEVENVGCFAFQKSPNNNQSSKITTQKQELNSSSILNSSNSITSFIITPSYDGGTDTEKDVKSLQQNNISHIEPRSQLITSQKQTDLPAKGSRRDIQVYFPEGFDWSSYPELAPYRSSVLWFAHNLHERRFVNADGRVYGPDDYITMKSEFARKIDPNFRHAIKLLLGLDIIQRDFYDPGTKSYGYRFVDPRLRHATRRRIPLDDKKLARRIDQHRKKQASTRTDRWLRSNLLKIGLAEIDEEFLQQVALSSVSEHGGRSQDKLDCYRYVLDRIDRKEHLWTPDDQGRRYSLVTNLKRELRSLLLVDGKRLQQIDIANSQLTFLALKMRSEGVECSEFLKYCERGRLYEHVAKHSKSTRAAVKKAITQRALFSTNDAACQKSKIKKTFDRLFPEVAAYLERVKSVKDGNSKLAKALQFAEADLIVGRVCGRLRREGQVDFVSPIHDCLVFLPKDADHVKSVMADEFAKLGLQPLLEVKTL